jgi:hypothetical protein
LPGDQAHVHRRGQDQRVAALDGLIDGQHIVCVHAFSFATGETAIARGDLFVGQRDVGRVDPLFLDHIQRIAQRISTVSISMWTAADAQDIHVSPFSQANSL